MNFNTAILAFEDGTITYTTALNAVGIWPASGTSNIWSNF